MRPQYTVAIMNAFNPAAAVPISVRVPSLPMAYSETLPGKVPSPKFTTYAYFPKGSKAIQPGPMPARTVAGASGDVFLAYQA